MDKINRHVLEAAQWAYDNKGGIEAAIEAAIKYAKRYGLRSIPYEKIDDDIGMEEFSGKPGGRPKYPFWKMEVGDIVVIQDTHRYLVSASLRSYAKANGKKFATGRVGNDEFSTRVKRIA